MKIQYYLITLLPFLATQTSVGQAHTYTADVIPAKLKAHANAVIRDEETDIEINKLNEVWITRHRTITVLNANGKYDGAVRVNYNKSRPVQSISGALYDARGRLIRKFKKSDFEDVSTIQDFSLFEDDREKRLLPVSGYPYTVSYQYRQKYKFTLYLPDWTPVFSDGVAVEKSTLRVTSPADIPVHYYSRHLSNPVTDLSRKGKVIYTWTLVNSPALAAEPYSPPFFRRNIPVVLLSPARFEYYGMKGSFNNWKEYGSWVYRHLLEHRDELPGSTVDNIRRLTKNISSPEEKARKIYHYAQQKNRYISIQIGKGGFQPMTASAVDKAGYGDCKALVNYMMALLKAAGIRSYYTEVYGGDDNISLQAGFASAGQGNHIILCLPLGKDTTWLECTDKYMPFGYLGTFTDNRNVLICTPEGGILTRTPQYADSVNRQQRSAQFVLDSAGNLRGKMNTTFEGILYEKRRDFETRSRTEEIKRTKAVYSFMQMNISGYGLTFTKQKIPAAWETLAFVCPRYAAFNENGLSVSLNPVNRFRNIPPMVRNRKNKVYIAHGYHTRDSLCFVLPDGYAIAFLPRDVHIVTPFGNYVTHLETEGNKLMFIRSMQLHSGIYPAESYAGFTRFLQQAAACDRQKFVIKHAD